MTSDLQRPTLDKIVGTRESGQHVLLTGTEVPIPVEEDVNHTGHRSITVSNSVVQIPEDLRSNDRAVITVESEVIRFWVDGGVPTATEGHELRPIDTLYLTGTDELVKFRAIRRDSSDATLRVTVGMRV